MLAADGQSDVTAVAPPGPRDRRVCDVKLDPLVLAEDALPGGQHALLFPHLAGKCGEMVSLTA